MLSWVGNVAYTGNMKCTQIIQSVILKETAHLENLDIDLRILEKSVMRCGLD